MPQQEQIDALSLLNICGGAAVEIFDRELNEVLKNISDVNTEADDKRSITIEVIFKPYEDRSGAEIELRCKSKTAPVTTARSRMFLLRRDGRTLAISSDPRQSGLFEERKEPLPDNVRTISAS